MLGYQKLFTKEQPETINLYKAFKEALAEKKIAEEYMAICEADYYDSAQRDFEAKESRMMAIWREIRRGKVENWQNTRWTDERHFPH